MTELTQYLLTSHTCNRSVVGILSQLTTPTYTHLHTIAQLSMAS